MADNPAQAVMDQLVQARREAQLWPSLQSNITQSPDAMTGGLTPPVMPLDARTMSSNLAQ